MSKYPGDSGYSAFRILQVAFVFGPIIAGLDKFFYILTNWSQYLTSAVPATIHLNPRGFMTIVGIIEIIAGLLVWWKPHVFAYLVALWLLLIIVNLFMVGGFGDIILRDAMLFLGAIALARISMKYQKKA